MRKNKIQKRNVENRLGIRLRKFCEILNPPEYRRSDFVLGMTISKVAEEVCSSPNQILDEIRHDRLQTTILNGKVRITSGKI